MYLKLAIYVIKVSNPQPTAIHHGQNEVLKQLHTKLQKNIVFQVLGFLISLFALVYLYFEDSHQWELKVFRILENT